MIFQNNKQLREKPFVNEKELQTYFETNMTSITGFDFIQTEFTVGNFRIDSLAYDTESNAFRIIEYKNVKNNSLIDQGYTYLKLMLERKADFVLKYNEVTGKATKIDGFDWSQSRILFVSPVFTPYQLNATDFKNLPFDLIKVVRYEDDIIDIDFIQKKSNVSISDLPQTDEQKAINKAVVVYDEETHLQKVPSKIQEIYEGLKTRILELGDIDVEAKKTYIAFKGSTNICDLELFKGMVLVTINVKKGTIDDPLSIAEDITHVGHHGNGDYRIKVKSLDDIDGAMLLIKQSYKVNKK